MSNTTRTSNAKYWRTLWKTDSPFLGMREMDSIKRTLQEEDNFSSHIAINVMAYDFRKLNNFFTKVRVGMRRKFETWTSKDILDICPRSEA